MDSALTEQAVTPARILRFIAFLGIIFLSAAAWQRPEALESLERWSFDRRVMVRGPRPSSGEVVIVAFDDATEKNAPELFTRREGLARVIRAVRAEGASAIGVDLFLSRPEALLGEEIPDAIQELLARASEASDGPARMLLAQIQEFLAGDAILEEAIAEAPDVVLALYLGDRRGPKLADRMLRRGTFGQLSVGGERHQNARKVLASLPAFTRAAAALGTVNIVEDPDKIVRGIPAVTFHADRAYAPLSLQVLALHQGFGRSGLAYSGAPPTLSYGTRSVALDDQRRLILDQRGRQAFPSYSALDLIAGTLPPDALRGKMVLLGITYLGHDAVHTPLDAGLPGVNLHAEAIEGLLQGDFVTRSSAKTDALLTLGLGVAILLIFILGSRSRASLRIALTFLALLCYLGLVWRFFVSDALWLPLAGPGLSCGVALLGSLAAAWVHEGRRRRRLRHTFAHYLAPAVIHELIQHPESLTPGGARRELSVLFCDIRSFTTLSEKLSPEEIVAFLGRYLDPMTTAILGAGGLLDKYIGDAIMAVFGAPVKTPEHPTQALHAALAMHRALDAIREVEEGELASLRVGLGINTGEMVVGNMGASNRFDYTVIGDAVNLASRMESLTKTYGVYCLVGEKTVAEAPDSFAFREVDRVRVKGKSRPVCIHELLSGPERCVAAYEDLPSFAAALAAWRAGEFEAARDRFTAFHAANPADPVAPLYLARLQGLGARAPEGWDGVFTFENK